MSRNRKSITTGNVVIAEICAPTYLLEDKLNKTNNELESLRQTNTDLVDQLHTSNTRITTLKTENDLLKDELMKPKILQQPVTASTAGSKPTLVIGDSLLRNLRSED